MGRLTLTRKQGESIRLEVDPDIAPEEVLRWLKEEGITITISEVAGSKVKVCVDAPDELVVFRDY